MKRNNTQNALLCFHGNAFNFIALWTATYVRGMKTEGTNFYFSVASGSVSVARG